MYFNFVNVILHVWDLNSNSLLQIIEGDNVPRQLCEDCFNKINDFDIFKLMCEYSEDRMKKSITVKLENVDMKVMNYCTFKKQCYMLYLLCYQLNPYGR